jgi:quinol monooxygenase YgiN
VPTISSGSDLYTHIVVLTARPEQRQQLLDYVTRETKEHLRHLPGFVSASFHTSDDGTRIVEYIQWASRATYEAARATPLFAAHLPVVRRLATAEADTYTVAHVVEAPPA